MEGSSLKYYLDICLWALQSCNRCTVYVLILNSELGLGTYQNDEVTGRPYLTGSSLKAETVAYEEQAVFQVEFTQSEILGQKCKCEKFLWEVIPRTLSKYGNDQEKGRQPWGVLSSQLPL